MNDNRDSIQAEKPVPPWEQPGFFRLDCEPHRGTLLNWLAFPSLFLCYFSILVQFVFFWSALHAHHGLWSAFTNPRYLNVCAIGLTFSLLGAPLSLASWVIARHDLVIMSKGLMDPAGEKKTSGAWLMGLVGLLVCGVLIAYCGTVLLVMR
jgi:hypothetical protein